MNEMSEALRFVVNTFTSEFWRGASRLPPSFANSLRIGTTKTPSGMTISVRSYAPFARAFEFGVGRYPIYPAKRKALGFSRWEPKGLPIRSKKYIGRGSLHRFLFRWVEFPGRKGNLWLYKLISNTMYSTQAQMITVFGKAFLEFTIRRVNPNP